MDNSKLIADYFKREKERLYSSNPNERGVHFYMKEDTYEISHSSKSDKDNYFYQIKKELESERKIFNSTRQIYAHFLNNTRISNYNARTYTGTGERPYELTRDNIHYLTEIIKDIIINDEELPKTFLTQYILLKDSGERGLGAKIHNVQLNFL